MPGGGCAELPRRGEAVARLPPSCVCVCACARSIRRGAKKILLLLFFIKSVPFCVSFSVSLCVSLAVSLMAFEPFIYRPCGVSLAVSLPVPCNVSRSVSQFGRGENASAAVGRRTSARKWRRRFGAKMAAAVGRENGWRPAVCGGRAADIGAKMGRRRFGGFGGGERRRRRAGWRFAARAGRFSAAPPPSASFALSARSSLRSAGIVGVARAAAPVGRSFVVVRSSVLACARGGYGRSVVRRRSFVGARGSLLLRAAYRPPARCAPSSLSSSSLPSSLRLACSRRRRPPPPLLSRSVRSLRSRPRLRSETALRQAHFRAPHRIASKC